MIYRHFKGGLYFVIGYATRFSKDFPAKSIEQIAIAEHTETHQQVAVLIVNDKLTGSTYYALDNEKMVGVHTIYRGLDGKHWVRPREMFNDNVLVVEDGGKFRQATSEDNADEVFEMPRFTKARGEYLFDTIAELMEKESVK